jgi:4-diphosphocytidyl-2C-methyl-D-erythritol kinase
MLNLNSYKSDIDFTIDKKLEQDLWNLVFKSQINFFQAQIKENSSSVSVGLSSGSSSGSNPSMISGSGLPIGHSFASKTNKNISSLKKHEAQASLFFFLEAARGFYTKVNEYLFTF